MKRIGILLLILAAAVVRLSAEQTPLDVIARLEKALQSLDSFQADFEQTVYSSSVSTPLKEKGRLSFKKPESMRWEYAPPEPKTYVYKEGLLLSYYPEDNQLWRQKIAPERYETDILALLAGKARLAEKYIIEAGSFPGGEEDSSQLKLIPKEEGENSYILLEINRKNWMIRRAILFDWAGNKIEYGFSRFKPNLRFSKDFFEIKIPPDCEIIEDAGPRKK